MRLDQLVRRNLRRQRVSSSLTALNVGLGALLVSVVLVLRWLFFAEAEHVVGLYYGRR